MPGNNKRRMKKVLVIAYAFPPMSYAGVFRTLKFCKYLPEFDWQPLVLTIKETRYHKKDYSLIDQIPKDVTVYRTPTIDPAMWYNHRPQLKKIHFRGNGEIDEETNKKSDSTREGKYIEKIKRFLFNAATFPDHMIFWIPFAVIKGIKISVKEKPDIIYVSSPPHSSHFIGLILSFIFRKPLVADFRDPWMDNDYLLGLLRSKLQKKKSMWLESLIINNATRVILNTNTNRNAVLRRYQSLNKEKLIVLTNGFDGDDVKDIETKENKKFTITFIGSIYPYFKTDLFFDGLKLWIEKLESKDISSRFQVLFIGSKNTTVETMVQERNISNVISFIDYLPKKKALGICLSSNLLLIMLGFNKDSKRIIPSKLFDYFLCKKPILAIVPDGEAAQLIRKTKTGYIVSEDDPCVMERTIASKYKQFIENGTLDYSPDRRIVEQYSILSLTKRLSSVFNEIKTT